MDTTEFSGLSIRRQPYRAVATNVSSSAADLDLLYSKKDPEDIMEPEDIMDHARTCVRACVRACVRTYVRTYPPLRGSLGQNMESWAYILG